jgi:hypothetical protein
MNKNIFLIALLLAVSLPLVGCNKSGKLAKRSEFKAPSGPVELKIKWPLGERVEQDLDMKQKMDINIPGQPAPMHQETTMGQGFGLTVLQALPDGGTEVEMDFLSARMSSKMGEKTLVDYDSTKKAAPGAANPVADMFGKIIGSKIQFFLDASNGVQRVEGVDDMIKRMSVGAQAQALAPLKSLYSEVYFKQMMSANQFMPTNAVQPGDTWPIHMEFPMAGMGSIVMNYDVNFARWEMHGARNCARLEFSGALQIKPDPNAKPGAMVITIPEGNTYGASWFDPELGITIDTTMNQTMTMVIQLPQNPKAKPGAPKGMTMTNQMTQVMTIKLASVK